MNSISVPQEIRIADISSRSELSFSPSHYRLVSLPNPIKYKVSDLLDKDKPFDKGVEPGSLWYTRTSPYYLIRTKALQEYSYLLYPKGDAITPVNPSVFKSHSLTDGDILMSKDSNIGECVIVNGQNWQNYMFSGGIVRLHPTCDRYYLFSFLKHPNFKQQLEVMTARGATISHAKTLWLNCYIPFPNQSDTDEVVRYVSALTQAIIEKEIAIREKAEEINTIIENELRRRDGLQPFRFQYPTLADLQTLGRFDAVIYDTEYKEKIALVENYPDGYSTPKEAGFRVIPGPSLEIKLIGTRIDSEEPQPNFYALLLPMNLSIYGTINVISYLGTAKKLPLLQKGDILFGEAGFQKGRSIVLLDGIDNCTTNAHGLYARREDGDVDKSIYFRCIFNWYRSRRLIDIMAVGGSGGHFSPEYFDYIRIPNFPVDIREMICRLYQSDTHDEKGQVSLDKLVEWHRSRNTKLGIWELDREMKSLIKVLQDVQKKIIQGSEVSVPI